MIGSSKPGLPRDLRALAPFAVLGVGCFAFAVICWLWTRAMNSAPPILPGFGIATAGLMLGGRRLWPAAALGLIASLLFNPLPTPLWAQLIIIANVLVSAIVTSIVIERVTGPFPFPFSNRSVATLVAACLAGALLATCFTVTAAVILHGGTLPGPPATVFARWLLRYALGAILAMPLILSWSEAGRDRWSIGRILHFMLVLVASAVPAFLVFLTPVTLPIGWLMFPAMVWAALAFQVRGAAASMAVVAAIAMVGTQLGHGPFQVPGTDPVAMVQLFLVIAASTLLFAAALADARRAEEKLRRYDAQLRGREAQLELFLRNAPAAIAILDRDMRYVATSHRFLIDYGLPTDRPLVGRSHFELFPELPPEWRAYHERALAGAEFSLKEDVLPRGNGRVDYIRWDLKPWRDENGAIAGVVLYTEVITEAVETRRRLEEAEARYRAVFEQVQVGVVRTTLDGRYLEVNDRASSMLERDRGVLLGAPFADFTHPEDSPADIASMQAMITGQIGSYTNEKRMLRPDGSVIWVHLNAVLVRRPDGTPDHFVAVMHDLSVARTAQEELREAHEKLLRVSRLSAMGAMASTLAHELNQPLAAITNYAEACRHMVGKTEDGTHAMLGEWLGRTAAEALRAGDIIRKMRRFTISGEISRQPEDLHAIIEATCAAERGSPAAEGVRIHYNFDSRVRLVAADRLQVEQVLANLLENAIEATEGAEERQVEITTQRRDDMVVISVADNGIGLPQRMRDNLFEPFRTTKAKGTGLGLPICRTIVEAHGGSLWAGEAALGGAVLHFTLPVHVSEAQALRDAG